MFFVYILKSNITGKHYIGHTNNVERRLKEHNRGNVFSTKKGKPYILVFKEEFSNRQSAVMREKFFKTHAGYNTLKKILEKHTVNL